ncbi:MAG: hypothetical protein P9M13_07525 [Candidatus Ancaeobacter aquaticus]|nr:hypothetical protein [Candidatus Ancaeobacter aquaticus]
MNITASMRYKRLRRIIRDIFFMHVFNQDQEEIKNTVDTLFILSAVILCISFVTTVGLVFFCDLPDLSMEVKKTYSILDDISCISSFFLMLSVFITASVKTGAFENYRAFLMWVSYMFILIGLLIITAVFGYLVFDDFKDIYIKTSVTINLP